MADEKKALEMLNEDTIYFLDKRGISMETLRVLEGENRSDDYDRDAIVKQHAEIQQKIFENNISDDFIKSRVDGDFKTLKGTHANKVNKLVGLGLTNKECKEMGFEKVLELAAEKYNKNLENASQGGNEELRNQLKDYQNKYIAEKEGREQDIEAYNAKIQEAENKANERLMRINKDNYFKDIYSGLSWGIDPKLVPIVQEKIQREVEEKYEILEGAKVTGKNGLNAISFDGKTAYSDLKEAVIDKYNEYNVSQKSQGDQGRPPVSAPPQVEEMSAEAREFMARMEQKRQAS